MGRWRLVLDLAAVDLAAVNLAAVNLKGRLVGLKGLQGDKLQTWLPLGTLFLQGGQQLPRPVAERFVGVVVQGTAAGDRGLPVPPLGPGLELEP